ncbi:MAG: hypothetical protein H0X36_04220 [Sphingomonadaceae bacterium]|nr:hypothetical protein [Sphingomonadaceae bacterium]
MTAQAILWTLCGGSLAVALFAAIAERRQARRSDPDRVAIVSWPLVMVLALFAAAAAAAFALKA